ncbi:MAG: PKD domain-containing protein, partial [Crocinitomix sp.]|nr:PKD domain-containing protein [Crocinitomix sp.]
MTGDEELVFPPIASFSADVTETCTGEVTFTDNSIFSPTSWFWDFGDGFTSADENPSHTYTDDGTYTVTLTVENEAGEDVAVETSYIVVDRPDAPTGTDVTLCGPGDATVSATGAGGVLNWFDAPVDGTLLGTGGDYTEFITESTNFYVQEEVPGPLLSVGPPDNTFGSGGNFNSNDLRGIFFDAYAPFTLESVRVYAQGAGDRNIQVLDGDGGAVVHDIVVNIPDGESVVNLNFDIAPAMGYYIKVTGVTVNLFRINDGSPTYPYEIPGLVALTGSNVADTPLDFYYYFFDWKIREANCISSRTLVTATVEPSFTVTVSDDVTIASGETTTLTSSAPGGVTYSWSPTTGLSDPGAATTDASPTVTTTYTVTVTDADGCENFESVTVTVDGVLGGTDLENASIQLHPNPT